MIDTQFYTKVKKKILEHGDTLYKIKIKTNKTGIKYKSHTPDYEREYSSIKSQSPEYRAKRVEWNKNYYDRINSDPVLGPIYREKRKERLYAWRQRQKELKCQQ